MKQKMTSLTSVRKGIAVIAMLFSMQACGSGTQQTLVAGFKACAQENHPARRTNHDSAGQVDHCEVEPDFPPEWTLLTNWGTKPEWLTPTSFVFVSNLVGDVYEMDIQTGAIEQLTGHFAHAGFTRVHVLSNGDLLLLGPSSGPQPPVEPLVAYDEGMFTGDLFILRKPYDGTPLPLDTNAWEGIAVSQETMQIAWSTSRAPFWVTNPDGSVDFFGSAEAYAKEPSEIRTGTIVYDSPGVARLVEERLVLSKDDVGDVFLEPQDFVGPGDETLLVSAYGVVDGFGDRLVVDMSSGDFDRPSSPRDAGYDEWEGVLPGRQVAFLEFLEPDIFTANGLFLFLYDFETREYSTVFDFTAPGAVRVGPHEPVFSEDGRWALAATFAVGGWPGYGAGILLLDMTSFL